jgi:hypothetical protein
MPPLNLGEDVVDALYRLTYRLHASPALLLVDIVIARGHSLYECVLYHA